MVYFTTKYIVSPLYFKFSHFENLCIIKSPISRKVKRNLYIKIFFTDVANWTLDVNYNK